MKINLPNKLKKKKKTILASVILGHKTFPSFVQIVTPTSLDKAIQRHQMPKENKPCLPVGQASSYQADFTLELDLINPRPITLL